MDQILKKARIFFFFLVAGLFSCTHKIRWAVDYGTDLKSDDFFNLDFVIVNRVNTPPASYPEVKTPLIGYASVGEAEEAADYWPQIKGASFVLEANPAWPGAHRVDVRSAVWQDILLDQIIPDMKAKGFKGVFLDTIDVATYLESQDPQVYKGSADAAVDLIKKIRESWPQSQIFPNNALEILDRLGPWVDGVVVEDLYTRADFQEQTYAPTPEADTQYKEKLLDAFRKKFKKPVYVILYAPNAQDPLAKTAVKRCRKKGYHWYITDPGLMKFHADGVEK